MKPMLPSLTFESPERPDWFYEAKYDGFRVLLYWDENRFSLTSRNEKSLNALFPEIEEYVQPLKSRFQSFLPLLLDGELVYLENPYKANFSALQIRGRLRAEKKIQDAAKNSPCRILAFDLLMLEGNSLESMPYTARKNKLMDLFSQAGLPLDPDAHSRQLLYAIKAHQRFPSLWEKIVLYDGEGIVAKYRNSTWKKGARTTQWLKYKNWKHVNCFLISFDKTNGYFQLGVYDKGKIHSIGQVLFGFKPDEKQVLQQIVKNNCKSEHERFIYVEPAICLEVKYLELYENELREAYFDRFRFDLKPQECMFEHFAVRKQNFPEAIAVTHPEKTLWENQELHISKSDYIQYLSAASSYMLPFLKNRVLTVIRFPHGMFGEPFYQKNCPDYAPSFIATYKMEGIEYIVCNDLQSLLWLGNQLAIEFHIPFQSVDSKGPDEIVFDLDPPSREDFPLAVKAALLLKKILDELKLSSFVKSSGNKGLQVYIPLPDHVFSYADTRLFTSFIANFLVSQDPDSFTIERMKKNRGHRLYVDYVQHSEGKTIIAPYSMRGNPYGGVATPLFWEELNSKLDVKNLNMKTALDRIKKHINPFKNYFQTKQTQPFQPVLDFLKKQAKG